ncbi:MarR family winged helix-turn-helix transcriptional regulator [Leucobacter massiliensis]|uniref:MarR family transcriptional regulator n=1 Tax=Leucobacter massiliensis TaxID=1686285 RepID=A0A2S9QN35_9MICO|nr:MarR family transcriptional regulator [Leucobacter massiliensis]PRI11006.1 MarR family transcriptional regulator [Leucobacter massiliensis]
MESGAAAAARDRIAERLYVANAAGGPSSLVDATGVAQEDVEQIARLMQALARLREAEQLLSEASSAYMRLSAQDMRALHYLIVAQQQGEIVTPGMIAQHLRISAASTTKLLNRLERDGHVLRRVHPTDRRAFAIEVTPETAASARATVGRTQARRFYAAARLSREEREAVTRFLIDMADELSLSRAGWAGGAEEADAAAGEGSEGAS